MAVLIINRCDREKRLLKTFSELRKVGLVDRVTRIEAVMPDYAWSMRHRELHPDALENINQGGQFKGTKVISSKGALACAASHRCAWEHIAALNSDTHVCHWVFEDDIHIRDTESFRMNNSVASDLIHDYAQEPVCVVLSAQGGGGIKQRGLFVESTAEFTDICCYMLNQAAAKYLIEITNKHRWYFQVDILMSRLSRRFCKNVEQNNNPIRLYIPSRSNDCGVTQFNHDSDVQVVTYNKKIIDNIISSLNLPPRASSIVYNYMCADGHNSTDSEYYDLSDIDCTYDFDNYDFDNYQSERP